MEYPSGRPNEIQDWLVKQKLGNWFSFSNADVRTYANLIILDGSTKPSESDCTNGLAALQAAWDAKDYERKRIDAYEYIGDQLDKLWHDIDDGKLDKTGSWYLAIKAVKDANPKP
tara:strand:+ start:184 stop:528 length:345 start_codon:yes stop_codon:yes gene_type:complete